MFTESQQRSIDLKEDDPSMVELMVKFFYTFDYNYPPAPSEVSSLAIHISVYLIADRYEVLHLKSMALERFRRDIVACCKDGKSMIQATRAVEESMPAPICDTALHDIVIRAWDRGGPVLFANIGEAGVSSLFAEIEWLSAALTTRAVSILKIGSPHAHCTNGNT
jgi:hypothetical protein